MRFLCLPIILALGGPVHAQTFESVDAIKASVRAENASNCKVLEFGDGFATPRTIDGDALPDLLVDYHGLDCDGSSMMFCGSAGCDMILYLQQPDGKFRQLAAFFGYAIDFDQPMAEPPSFVVALHGNECGRSGMEPCSIRYKIEGNSVVEIGEVDSKPAD